MTTLTSTAPLGFSIPGLSGLRAALRRRAEYSRVYGELSSLSDRDLADIGLSRSVIAAVAAEAARTA